MEDLYEIAEQVQRTNPKRYRQVYFEERKDGGLVFDTYPAQLYVAPLRTGSFLVEFSWAYRTEWDETESAEVEMGEYVTARGAVKRAMELALWSDDDIREAFNEAHLGSTGDVPAIEYYEEPSPLVYPRSGNVQRFALYSPELVDTPFEPHDTYFAQTERVQRYGKSGAKLKKPKVEIIPGARPGTLAWLDWHTAAPQFVYIDFMKVRNDWRSHGAGRQLVEAFYKQVVVRDAVENIHWGQIVSPYAWKIYQRMVQLYPNVSHGGRVDF
jgi:hypothetical protein